MTKTQLIDTIVIMIGGVAVAMILGKTAPLPMYAAFIAAGIAIGVATGCILRKMPGIEGSDDRAVPHGGPGPAHHEHTFFPMLRESFAQASFRHFVAVFFAVVFVSSVTRNFILVYSRQVFAQSDSMVTYLTVAGNFGNMVVFMLIKFFVDRIGAKPIYVICTLTGLVSLLPMVIAHPGLVGTKSFLFLAILFFLVNFGFLGAEGIARTYFLAMVPQKHMMDMGIVYYFVFGLGGAGGSFLAGVFLDILANFGMTPTLSFRLLFGVLAVLLLVVFVSQKWLVPLGSLPLTTALGVLFSPRDIKAIALLDRLNKTKGSQEEQDLLEQLHDAPSTLAIHGLLERVKSPQLAVRLEALHALEAQSALTSEAETALLDDLEHNPFTTAYLSARILGAHGATAAVPLLRALTLSTDSMLAGEALLALARLGDQIYRPAAERLVTDTDNPRLKLMGATALGIFGSPNSVSTLLGLLEDKDPPPYLREEITLAMAQILGMEDDFYPLLTRLRQDSTLAATLASDEAEVTIERFLTINGGKKRILRHAAADPVLAAQAAAVDTLMAAVSRYILLNDGVPLACLLERLPDSIFDAHPLQGGDRGGQILRFIFTQTVLMEDLSSFDRLRLLICQWACRLLRLWTAETARKNNEFALHTSPINDILNE
jgi:HEAT repeat protein